VGAGSDGDESIPPFLENPSQSNQGKAVFVHRFSSIPGDCVAPTRIVLLSPCRNHWIWNVIAWQLFSLRCDAHTSTTSADVARAWPSSRERPLEGPDTFGFFLPRRRCVVCQVPKASPSAALIVQRLSRGASMSPLVDPRRVQLASLSGHLRYYSSRSHQGRATTSCSSLGVPHGSLPCALPRGSSWVG